MRRMTRLSAAFMFAAVAASVAAHEYHAGSLLIMHPWARATTTDMTAVYLKIMNDGADADRLLRITTDIGRAEVHETKHDGGVAKMRPVESLAVPAKKEISFQPGGLHIMVSGLKKPLVEGFGFPMTLVFEKAGEVKVDVLVQKAGAKSEAH